MHPTLRRGLQLAVLTALTLTLSPPVVIAADGENDGPVDPSVRPPPRPLSAASRVKVFAAALQRAGVKPTANAAATLPWRVTPMATRHENGTRITAARPINFISATSAVPEGLYKLSAYSTLISGSIHFRVHTEKDRLYVADCRMVEQGYSADKVVDLGGKVLVTAPGVFDQEYKVQDGHVLFVFRGAANGSTVELEYEETHPARWMAFYGCDFGPVE